MLGRRAFERETGSDIVKVAISALFVSHTDSLDLRACLDLGKEYPRCMMIIVKDAQAAVNLPAPHLSGQRKPV